MNFVIHYQGEQSIVELKIWRGNAYAIYNVENKDLIQIAFRTGKRKMSFGISSKQSIQTEKNGIAAKTMPQFDTDM